MRIGEANHKNYKEYMELFKNLNSKNQNKTQLKEPKYKEENYKYEKNDSYYCGNTIQDVLTGHVKN